MRTEARGLILEAGSELRVVEMPLLNLPLEILISIYENLGSIELRRDVEYLLVCKRLYKAAQRMYLKGHATVEITVVSI